jgi:hypothetical protein
MDMKRFREQIRQGNWSAGTLADTDQATVSFACRVD